VPNNLLNNRTARLALIISASVYFLALLFWLLYDPTQGLKAIVPGMDKKNVGNVASENIKIGEIFKKLSDFSSPLKGSWPMFRGQNHDNIVSDPGNFNANWNAKEPKIRWSVELGEGHAAPVISDGLAYILDYDEKNRADLLRVFSLADGKEIWQRGYKIHHKRNHGMSRTIPALNENVVVSIGPRCHVMCCDKKTGDLKWALDLEKQYGTETPLWYTGQCPLIDNNMVILAPSGKSMMIGVDCQTGKVLWETPNPKNWKMSHSSVIPATMDGKRMYIYAAVGGICGVSAEPADLGKLLWSIASWAPSVVAPSPVPFSTNKIYLTAGYGAGSAVLQILRKGEEFSAKVVQELKPNEGIACEQQTPILYNKLLFSILPKDGGTLKNQFVCYNPEDCSKPVWTSGKTNRYGLGPYLLIGQYFLILDDDGTLSLLKASTSSFQEVAKKRFFEGQDAWGPMAFADGYLLLRDSKQLYCLDLR
jgi:outer membrane protein assembly factor BamB